MGNPSIDALAMLHLTVLALWGGVVATEAVIEVAATMATACRAGIVLVENSDELFPVAETLSSLPPVKNNRVAVLADGGGHATIAADLLSEGGVEIPPLNEKTQVKLREFLPAAASVRTPVDVAGGADADPEIFAHCARVLLHDPQIGGLLIVGLFGGYSIRFAESLAFVEEDAAHQMGKLVAECKKPIVVHSLYNHARPHSLDLLRYYNIPVYDSLEIASRTGPWRFRISMPMASTAWRTPYRQLSGGCSNVCR